MSLHGLVLCLVSDCCLEMAGCYLKAIMGRTRPLDLGRVEDMPSAFASCRGFAVLLIDRLLSVLLSGQNMYTETETITKYEIMDGAPVRGTWLRIRERDLGKTCVTVWLLVVLSP